MKIAIIIFDRFTDLDLFLPWDILNRVRSVGGVQDWSVRILGTKPAHLSEAGLATPTSGLIHEAKDADVVLFASGILVPELIADPGYIKQLQLDPDRQWIGAMCSGALLLAALGLLDGKEATTYPTRRKLLAQFPVTVVDKPFVADGRVATAAGCLAAIDLSRWVIEETLGTKIADRVLQTIQPVGQGLLASSTS